MRGEQIASVILSTPFEGSPPHARGAEDQHVLFSVRQGITPACAGSSSWPAFRQGARGDHPRMRGEQRYRNKFLQSVLGSPPHARGAERSRALEITAARITPACAGSRLSPRTGNPSRRDHPPHARGAVHRPRCERGTLGITPAYAGSSARKEERRDTW